MEDGVTVNENKVVKMGASNAISTRLSALLERKKQIEENLTKRNQELRQLCIQEAELTGITPPEMPLEPGETLPQIRRQVKTAYEFSENLVDNNKDSLITSIELQIQLHANLAEAALGLANEQNMSKTVKRQHRTEYQKHKSQCIALQEKLALLKEKNASELKQKKKPRANEQGDDSVSLHTNLNEGFTKSDLRHSIRSIKHSQPSSSESSSDQKYFQSTSRYPYRNSELSYIDHSLKPEDLVLNSGFYRLSLNGYNKYMERQENTNIVHPCSNYGLHSSSFVYSLPHSSMQQQHNPHYQQGSPHMSQHSPHLSQHSSPHLSHHASQSSPLNSPHISQYSPRQHSPQLAQHSPQLLNPHSTQSVYNYSSQFPVDFSKYSASHFSTMHRQSSPSSLPQKSQYFSSHTIHGQTSYRQYQSELRNPHQIQPHQQYEQMNGGYWNKTETGELVWCNSNAVDSNWQRDKRFGSLDRRKNKRIHKRISPSVDNKPGMVSTVPNYPDQVRNASVKTSQIVNRRSQDNVQLVRTQSLGSVGAQTVDSVYPSDDNSSCESDNRSMSDVNQMLETSLDSPVTTTPSALPVFPQQAATKVLTPEEKYVVHSPPPPIPPPLTPKPLLEIPAESNPSHRLPDTTIELFNNNIPKNCTIVQAGHCKPYHEETKPFEMSDFYKYSTKFKKSPVKVDNENARKGGNVHVNLKESFKETEQVTYKVLKNQNCNNSGNVDSMDNSGNLNASLDLAPLAVSEHFSAEMNAWYKDQQQSNNNNTGSAPKNRSTATLV
ncbi:hypothetical protein NQ317_019543 [Molorchus minor]|uniref:Cytohesin Ubiquitin Protein Inducing domain-containing protein n=1 Tax=Molorchus minor TaxID=1323400 RepID=A0ABQ9J693_9CUCU|nr:hypothetical protein NQ317_019543 [Molorchus minor]